MARTTRRPPEDEPLKELVELALDLDLTALALALPDLLDRGEREALSFTDFAIAMLRAEVNTRLERHLGRSLKRSRLGHVEGVDGFDFTIRPQLEARVIHELLKCRFAAEKRNILCLGKPGLGKTRIAKALVHACCLSGYSTLAVVTADMIEELHASQADGSTKRVLRRYVKPDVLLLDEFGYQAFDAEATNYLFRVVAARHGNGAIVLTANTGFTKWKSLFPSEAMAIATVDRLVDRATILRFTGHTSRGPLAVHGAPLED